MIEIERILEKLRPGEAYDKFRNITTAASYNKYIVWKAATTKPTFAQVSVLVAETDLEVARENAIADITVEAKGRVGGLSDESIDILDMISPFLNNIPAPNPLAKKIAIAQYKRTKSAQINGQNLTTVRAYNAKTDPNFPKG